MHASALLVSPGQTVSAGQTIAQVGSKMCIRDRVVESLLGIVALVVVGAVAVGGTKPEGTPFAIDVYKRQVH